MIPNLHEMPPSDDALIPMTNYGISELNSFIPDEEFTYVALKIARSRSGEFELRLLSELISGEHNQYVLQTSTLAPYKSVRTPLLDGKRKAPKTLNHAMRIFSAHVMQTLPATKHSSGIKLSTHDEIL